MRPFSSEQNVEAALFDTMVLIAMADGRIVDAERDTMAKMLVQMPEFNSLGVNDLEQGIEERVAELKQTGPRAMVSSIGQRLRGLRPKVRALEVAVRVLRADRVADEREVKIWHALRSHLQVPRNTVGRLERLLKIEGGPQRRPPEESRPRTSEGGGRPRDAPPLPGTPGAPPVKAGPTSEEQVAVFGQRAHDQKESNAALEAELQSLLLGDNEDPEAAYEEQMGEMVVEDEPETDLEGMIGDALLELS